MQVLINTLFFQIKYILAEDGSGRGGAFVAAVAMRLRNSNH